MQKLFTTSSKELLSVLKFGQDHAIKIANNKCFVVINDTSNFGTQSTTFKSIKVVPDTLVKNDIFTDFCFDLETDTLKKFLSNKGIVTFHKKDDKIVVENEGGSISFEYKYNITTFTYMGVYENFYFDISAKDLLYLLNNAKSLMEKKLENNAYYDYMYICLNNSRISFNYASLTTTSSFVSKQKNEFSHKDGFVLPRNLIYQMIGLIANMDCDFTITFDENNKVSFLSSDGNFELSYKLNFSDAELIPAIPSCYYEDYRFDTEEMNHFVSRVININKEDLLHAEIVFLDNNQRINGSKTFEKYCEIIINNDCVKKLRYFSNINQGEYDNHSIHVNLVSLLPVLKKIGSNIFTLRKYFDKNAGFVTIFGEDEKYNMTFNIGLVKKD